MYVIIPRCLCSNDLPILPPLGGVMQEGLDDRMNDDSISPWWDRIRHSLAQSTSVSKAFLMAAVCRSVAMAIITANKKVQVTFSADQCVSLSVPFSLVFEDLQPTSFITG